MDHVPGPAGDRFLLWIDAVGGYLVLMQDDVVLGQPARESHADVPILGDISARHARISRDGEGYLLEALRPVWLNGRAVDRAAMLTHGCTIQLGSSVKLAFQRAHALSATARLSFLSPHRTEPSVDAVLLMADSCVLGPRPQSHIVCRNWPGELILYRYGDQLQCRTRGWLEIDGVKHKDRGPVRLGSRIVGEQFSMSLEAF